MSEFATDWQMDRLNRPKTQPAHQIAIRRGRGDGRIAFLVTTDLDSLNDAQDRGAAFGFDVQLRFPREPLPGAAAVVFVALDELLLGGHDRREYLARLRALKRPFPVVILSHDFDLDPPTVVRPGLMLAARLDDGVFRAVRDGHVDPSADEDERQAA